jgi:NADH:ubiquinone oxidoreductase subunit 6 (subunit J)
MSTLFLAIIAALILASAALAMSLRNLIYSALLLILTWMGVASFYLWAGAEFVAFAQLLIYVGAVSMIVLFAVLLTRRTLADPIVPAVSLRRGIAAMLVGGAVGGVLFAAVFATSFESRVERPPSVSVRQLGFQLMNQHAASLLVIGLILTVTLIGATIIAATHKPTKPEDRS